MTTFLALAVIAAAVWAIVRRVDVRLALTAAALILGLLARQPEAIVRTFLAMLTREQFIVPICCAMGFAHVLRLTTCDQHLVHLLTKPLARVHWLLVPGTVVIGFLVNMPVVSQTSTAVAIGSVLLPILLAARLSAATAGAALLLGCSLGGELLNPGAPEFRTVTGATGATTAACVAHVLPLVLPHLAVATMVFWVLSARSEARQAKRAEALGTAPAATQALPEFHVKLLKAAVPAIPITLLFLANKPLEVIHISRDWLVDAKTTDPAQYDSRLIGAAMLVGVFVAAVVGGGKVLGVAGAFFEGAGYAYANIISVIVTATCFGQGVELIGLARAFGEFITRWPHLLIPTAGGLPLSFAWVSGSGMASTQSLFGFFVEPARAAHVDPVQVGAVVSIAAAAGRTMSPVAAVALMCAAMTGTNPFELIKRTALPLLAGIGVVVVLAAVGH